ncbi:MAG: glycosyltransferase N-terminal domain-containing protein [Bacteroidota bacterium]|nr:glycosyltransferase N-terminal domain-containing protein [Bacteroidota bacterium]
MNAPGEFRPSPAWRAAYSFLFLPLFWLVVHLLTPWNRKVRKGLRGRRGVRGRLEAALRSKPDGKRAWVHVSSMGEFEQAKPIIERLKELVPGLRVVVSFFSPSGFEHSFRYEHADCITYIPFDAKREAARFLDVVRPSLALFVRYDVWPNHVWECSRRGIPVVLVNATLRTDSARLLPLARSFHERLYGAFEVVITVSEQDAAAFARLGLPGEKILVAGDTRFDRVAGRAAHARTHTLLPEKVTAGRRVLVLGSTWPEDEEVVLPAVLAILRRDPEVLCVIVPHEPTVDRLEGIEYRLRGRAASRRFSYISAWEGERVILVDAVGLLLPLYACASIAFVGGGFRSNVHNTLEPAAYGIPVLYGPRIQNSREAEALARCGGGFIVSDRRAFYKTVRQLLTDERLRAESGTRAAEFVAVHAGATERIVERLLPLLGR